MMISLATLLEGCSRARLHQNHKPAAGLRDTAVGG